MKPEKFIEMDTFNDNEPPHPVVPIWSVVAMTAVAFTAVAFVLWVVWKGV